MCITGSRAPLARPQLAKYLRLSAQYGVPPAASCPLPAAWCVCQLLIPFARLILVDKRTWHPATHSWLRSSQLAATSIGSST